MWFGYEALSGLADIADDATKKLKRLQSFRLAVSKETLKLVEHLPIKDKEDLDEILSAMEDHIVGTTNEVFERREFWKRTQQEGESFSDYMLALRELSSRCNFGKYCNNCEALQLRDRVTTGLRDSTTIEKLLAVGSSLTLPKVKEICEADESAKEECAVVTSSVNFLRRKTSAYKASKKNPPHPSSTTKECIFCGRKHEFKKERCPAFGKTCANCHGKNHFAVKCRKAKKAIRSKPKLLSKRSLKRNWQISKRKK